MLRVGLARLFGIALCKDGKLHHWHYNEKYNKYRCCKCHREENQSGYESIM